MSGTVLDPGGMEVNRQGTCPHPCVLSWENVHYRNSDKSMNYN